MPKDRYAHSTVSALKTTLDSLPDDALILLAGDAEGNDFQPLDGVDTEARWNEAAGHLGMSWGATQEESKNLRQAIVLFPMHP